MTRNTAVQFNRISSEGQDDGFSLDAQDSLGKNYAKIHKLKVVKSWSEVESAYKEDKRKHFFAMIDYVKKNDVKNVIFDKVDRAVRGFRSAVVVENLVENEGVRFHFTREALVIDENSSPQDKFRFYLFAIMGKYYVDNLKQEQKKGVSQRIKSGHWSWACPVGYKYSAAEDSKRKIVTIDEDVAPAVREIFTMYATGNYALSDLIGILNKVTPDRKYRWKMLCGMLENPFYYGAMRVKGKVMDASHEPLVSKELWTACQRIRGIRAKQYQKSASKADIDKPFMQLIKCGACGRAVTGEAHRKKSGKTYIYYRCAHNSCEQRKKTISQPKLVEQIYAAIEPFKKFKQRSTQNLADALRERLTDFDAYTLEVARQCQEEELKILNGLKTAEDFFEKNYLSKEEFEKLKIEEMRKIADLRVKTNCHEHANDATKELGLEVIEQLHFLKSFFVLDSNLLSQVEMVRILLSNLSLTDGTLSYDYEKSFDVLANFGVCRGKWAHQDLNLGPIGYEPIALTN